MVLNYSHELNIRKGLDTVSLHKFTHIQPIYNLRKRKLKDIHFLHKPVILKQRDHAPFCCRQHSKLCLGDLK